MKATPEDVAKWDREGFDQGCVVGLNEGHARRRGEELSGVLEPLSVRRLNEGHARRRGEERRRRNGHVAGLRPQ